MGESSFKFVFVISCRGIYICRDWNAHLHDSFALTAGVAAQSSKRGVLTQSLVRYRSLIAFTCRGRLKMEYLTYAKPASMAVRSLAYFISMVSGLLLLRLNCSGLGGGFSRADRVWIGAVGYNGHIRRG